MTVNYIITWRRIQPATMAFTLLLCWISVLFNTVKASVLVGGDIISNRFVLALKTSSGQGPEMLRLWAQDNGYKISRMFPLHLSPEQAVNEMGLPLTDLSLIYQIDLALADPTKAIKAARQLPLVAWAEPLYHHHLLFTPNDPFANPAVAGQGNYLNLIKAYDAWNVTKGDSTIKIGIVDSGLDVLQEDLRNKIAINLADPINGIDDDNNGYVDDYYGWNFFTANNNLSIAPNSNGHGQVVASIAAAEANNGKGIAGIGYRTQFVPVVIFGPGNASSPDLYSGIVYAADRGCQVINLSWGRNRNNQSQFERAIINYAAINKNATIVAAAGNTPAELDFLPASYPYVMSVAYTDYNDNLDVAATFSTNIDINAPGGNIFAVNAAGGYNNSSSGSSFAAPMVAAGAALLKGLFPSYNALQIAELLRINTDNNLFTNVNRNRFDRVGTGRLNLVNAVTRAKAVAMRASEIKLIGRRSGSAINAGDTIDITFKMTNYLNPVLFGNVQVSVSAGRAVVVQGFWQFGALPTLGTASNINTPLKIYLPPNTPVNEPTILVFRFGGNNYIDNQSFKFFANGDMVTLENNRFLATYSSPARIAYQDVTNQIGNSIALDDKILVSGAGLVIGANPTQVPNNIMDTLGKDLHFGAVQRISMVPSAIGVQRATSLFKDSLYGPRRLGIAVRQTITGLSTIPANRCHIIEYELFNQSQTNYDSVSVGVFTDWDIHDYRQNFAKWDTTNKLGYCYSAPATSYYGPQIYAGVQVVGGGEPQYFASDLDQNVFGTNINFNNNFSLANKFRVISRGILRPEAGFSKPTGNDVATITSVKIRRLLIGQRAKVAFVIGAGYTLQELQSTANSAKASYSAGRTGPLPTISNQTICAGSTVYLVPTNGQQFNFYDRPALSNPIGRGRFLLVRNLRRNTTYYITNTDSVFESQATAVTINITGPQADFTMTPSVLDLRQGNNVNFISQSTGATNYSWDFGNQSTSTLANTTQRFTTPGIYQIKLIVRSNISPCQDTLQLPLVVTDGTTSLDQLALSQTSLLQAYQPYPIPADQQVGLQAAMPYQIWDNTGRLVAQGQDQTINTARLPNGIYQLRVRPVGVGQLIYKLVIQH